MSLFSEEYELSFNKDDINNSEMIFTVSGIKMPKEYVNLYTEQINKEISLINEYIEKTFPDKKAADIAWQHIIRLTHVYKDIYFEIGMRVGAKIGYQLHNDIKYNDSK